MLRFRHVLLRLVGALCPLTVFSTFASGIRSRQAVRLWLARPPEKLTANGTNPETTATRTVLRPASSLLSQIMRPKTSLAS